MTIISANSAARGWGSSITTGPPVEPEQIPAHGLAWLLIRGFDSHVAHIEKSEHLAERKGANESTKTVRSKRRI